MLIPTVCAVVLVIAIGFLSCVFTIKMYEKHSKIHFDRKEHLNRRIKRCEYLRLEYCRKIKSFVPDNKKKLAINYLAKIAMTQHHISWGSCEKAFRRYI